MGGSTKETVVQNSSAPANPNVTKTVDQLLGGVQGALAAGPKPFNETLYAGTGPTTEAAWAMGKGAATNPAYGEGVSGAIDNYSKVARGDYLDNVDPDYQAMIDRAANGTAADINASMGGDGRYGSNVHVNALTDSIGALRTGAGAENRRFELGRQSEAAGLLPQLMGAGQLPASITGQIGAAEDADAQAALTGRYDLQQRQANAQTDLLAKLTSILNGNAASSGTNSTQTTTQPATPLWQQLLGGGIGLAGAFL